MNPQVAAAVGARLRETRRVRALSVGALAARAGVGKGSLSEIENGVRNPTLSTLYALAGALGVPLATLLAERAGAEIASPGIVARLLDATRHADGTTVEVYLLHLDPGARHPSTAHGPGVVEHLLVTHGRVRAGPSGRETEAGPGETLTWESATTHAYRSLGDTPAEAVLTIRSPSRDDDQRE
ncbi:helix-turn-helix transcriptional regulator [Frankia sp. CNm7]|uniref:Helix-turn-helix transcriptional regulator n=1 Tax=Frankia nepalensis TaxID=1836974 RepID=A0A937UMD2_9ACTN|nr:XRE family transcriptional regulator [Frankia nepalensis]MBL7499250.1 helix-turn-helix transcriptional regulator [Frankia nepalensis]MBL7512035.1 helix-turn-helix transcriptional regulator [Frankia nepalensis]MBL7518271.1 helix-turn-helix transcriptional regulator [Frankia nepalensis]MBL7628754.1 helix-turn-helix transcriptional regulator [Frankia nepalensis]